MNDQSFVRGRTHLGEGGGGQASYTFLLRTGKFSGANNAEGIGTSV